MKPRNYVNHMTLSEVAREIGCDSSWIRKLERAEQNSKGGASPAWSDLGSALESGASGGDP